MSDSDGIIGIIGGMGNEAMVDLAEKIAQVPEHKNRNYVFFGNSRLAYKPHELELRGAALKPADRRKADTARHTADIMHSLGCGVTGLACNSAHELFREVMRNNPVRFVDMVKETAHSMLDEQGKVLVMGVTSLVESGLYQNALHEYGVQSASPSRDNQAKVMAAIYDTEFGIKTGQITENAEELLCSVLREESERQGCSHVILGCTEIPLAFSPQNCARFKREGLVPGTVQIVDASNVLAGALVSAPCPPSAPGFPNLPQPGPDTDWFPPAAFKADSLGQVVSIQRMIFRQTDSFLGRQGSSVTGSYMHLPTLFLVGEMPHAEKWLARQDIPALSPNKAFDDTVESMLEAHFAAMA